MKWPSVKDLGPSVYDRVVLRVFARDVRRLRVPAASISKSIEDVVELSCAPGDDLFERISKLESERSEAEDVCVLSWRFAGDQQLPPNSARVWLIAPQYFLMYPRGGADCPRYDVTTACGFCEYGAQQITRVRLSKKPKGDIAFTPGGEIIVSARLRERIVRLTSGKGVCFAPVSVARMRTSMAGYSQLVVGTIGASLVKPTQWGTSPFLRDDPQGYGCPHGHSKGFDLVTPAFLNLAPESPPIFYGEPGSGHAGSGSLFRIQSPLLIRAAIASALFENMDSPTVLLAPTQVVEDNFRAVSTALVSQRVLEQAH